MTTYSASRLPLSWDWRLYDDNPNEWAWTGRFRRRHDLSHWLPVTLPTSVQEALWRAGRLRHSYRDLHSRDAEWVEHRDWLFGCDFILAPPPIGERVFLDFDAVDDACTIFLNGVAVGAHEGPGAPFDQEIGALLQAGVNQLFVLIHAPASEDPQTGGTERTRSLKGRMGYGWDFAPRLVRVGILGPVRLTTTGAHRLRDLWARPTLSDDHRQATVALAVRVDGPAGAAVRFTVQQEGRVIAEASAEAGADGLARAVVELAQPDLWWPNGLGGEPLYTATAECADGSDRVGTRFGVREVRWEGTPGGAAEEWPLALVVNGRRVFQRGWNWVPADSLGGPRADRRARRLLLLARVAGVNVLRCWGGGDPETPAFYTMCDQLGLLVWQEFPLSSAGISNAPPTDPTYLDRVATYAQAVIAARRNHPSLALWGGGNELTMEGGVPLTMAHPYAERLGAVVAATDPDRMFRPSSPLGPIFDADPEKGDGWDVHGPWEYSERQIGAQYWRLNAITPILHSELGLPGAASLETERRYLSPHYWGRTAGNPARRHHGGAWWDHQKTVDRAFGPIADEALAVLASQWLQAEGLRYYIEETRRRWPHSVGIYPWQLDEPWPNVVCTSAVEYGGRPKLAYYAVRNAYRPLLPTAHYPGLQVAPGDPLTVEVWALNDGADQAADLTITLHDLAGRDLMAPQPHPVTVPGESSIRLLDLRLPLPDTFSVVCLLTLSLAGMSSRYCFSNAVDAPFATLLDHPALMTELFINT
jgi:beta-mannosidase